jgi:FixJ family two-component response regulator
MSGLELADVLAGRGIRLPIIFLTAYGDIPMSVRAMKGGAIDFLEKPIPAATIISRVNEALQRHRQQHEHDITIRAAREKLGRLTAREHEVMRLVLNGDHNKVIARRLGISHRTVELHRSRIMGKLGVTSLIELVNMATAAGLVVPPGI